jgi:nicotinate phosphoribosyltransferase
MIPQGRISPLFTDLYEITMAAAYHAHRIEEQATFSLFIRPPWNGGTKRGYYVAAGLEEALEALENFAFDASDLAYLKETGLFHDDFLAYLETLNFIGEIHALQEGTIFFADEPILEVTAPIIQAQLLETFLINTIGMATMIASKAARCFHAADGRPLIDFSLRRTQGVCAGMTVARSSYLAGFTATSNALAAKKLGIPAAGTMAHSFVTAFASEREAFEAYAAIFPDSTILLIDTYDTVQGARKAAEVGLAMRQKGRQLKGVRLDSGDMVGLSRRVRQILDEAGLPEVKIFASSSFDEYKIADFLGRGARIDAFGVGTKMGVSADAPYLDTVYKMVRFGERDVRKKSPGKITLAGEKQVFRRCHGSGQFAEDVIALRSEAIPEAEPLMQQVMRGGRRWRRTPQLPEIRRRFQRQLDLLDKKVKALEDPSIYPVKISPQLRSLQSRLVDTNH